MRHNFYENKDSLDQPLKKSSLDFGYLADFFDEGNTLGGLFLDSGAENNFLPDFDAPSRGPTSAIDYVDGLCPLFVILELSNGRTQYHPTQMTFKTGFSVLAATLDFIPTLNKLLLDYGLQMLSFITQFSGPASLISASLEFCIATINYYNANKERNFEGWLEERVLEVNYVDEEIEKLNSKIAQLSKNEFKSDHDNKKEKLKLERDHLRTQKQTLLNDIESRSRVYYHNNVGKMENKTEIWQPINDQLAKIHNRKNRRQLQLNSRNTPTQKDQKRDHEIQQQLESRYYDARGRFYIRAFSLFSMSLLFLGASIGCPPLIIVATILSYTAITTYFCNYGYKAIQSTSPASTTNKNAPARKHRLNSNFTPQLFKSNVTARPPKAVPPFEKGREWWGIRAYA